VEQALTDQIIKHDETVTVIMTGNGLKDPNNAQKAIDQPVILQPKLTSLISYLKEKGDIDHA
jgi:threonine synthase